jgi:hypothetical protein
MWISRHIFSSSDTVQRGWDSPERARDVTGSHSRRPHGLDLLGGLGRAEALDMLRIATFKLFLDRIGHRRAQCAFADGADVNVVIIMQHLPARDLLDQLAQPVQRQSHAHQRTMRCMRQLPNAPPARTERAIVGAGYGRSMFVAHGKSFGTENGRGGQCPLSNDNDSHLFYRSLRAVQAEFTTSLISRERI